MLSTCPPGLKQFIPCRLSSSQRQLAEVGLLSIFYRKKYEEVRKGMLEWEAEKEGKCKHKTCSWISGRSASGIPKQIANKECVDVKMSNI